VVGGPLWRKLTAEERQIFETVYKEAAAKASAQIRKSELTLADWFKGQGKTVVTPDKAAFIAAAKPLHNDAAAGAGWTKAHYDRMQALGAKTN
jgi:TRAP-type C4-dicarboxylate transport system substrate-binding protein